MHDIDINKITAEAEAGNGHTVRMALDALSFADRGHTLCEVGKLSAKHHHDEPNKPYVTFTVETSNFGDEGYAQLELDRRTPHMLWLGSADQTNPLYEDCIELSSGSETFLDANIRF